MTPFQHRIILPPILLVIHSILLIPLFLPIPPNGNVLSIEGLPLHLQYSIPLGIVGFVVVMVTKQLAVKIPLPKDPRKKRLAEGLEWAVLFLVGFLEEVWRWGVVRILVKLEGGDGGYGTVSWVQTFRTNTAEFVTLGNASGGRLWKGVYFMGWVWCCIESGFAWRSFAPHSEEGRHSTQNHHHHHQHQRHDRSHRHRHEGSPQPSPRTAYFPHSRGSHGVSPAVDAADSVNPFFSNFRAPVWEGSDSRQNLSKTNLSPRDPPRVEIHPSPADPSRTMFGSQCTFGGASCFGITGGQVSTGSPRSPTTGRFNRDLEAGQGHEENSSDNEYGDDEDDCYSSSSESDCSIRSSSETAGSRSATPLLSSSLPYDPNSEHPHQAFEQQSLLQSQYRRMSYNTLTEPVPVPSNTNSDNEDLEAGVIVRDYGQNEHAGEATRVSPPRPRAYPSYPSYSASYNHSYFSASPATRNRPLNLHLPGSPRSPLSTIHDEYFPRHLAQEQQQPQQPQRPRASRLPLHHYLRMIYGVDTNSLNIWLPILWRTAGLLRGLGHALLFAWFPSLIHKGHFQVWTLLMVSFIAVQKGWYTVEWVGGTVARNGVVKVSVFTIVLSLAVYLAGLKLWCIIP